MPQNHLPDAAPRPTADGRPRPLAFPADFTQTDGLWRPARVAARAFDYTDGGAVEANIHRIVRVAADRSSGSFELERGICDWPTEYHLSRARASLLRPFDLARYENVLEVGAGCGAITRYLSETCRRVTALEGSLTRAAIVRDRCADRGNVTCVCANVDDVAFAEKFDLVVVVGVLEYAGKYLAGRGDPWQAFLRHVLDALAPGGACLLAIENQLGLKYFGGAAEDHTGRPYEGIEGYYPGTAVRTFGRAELVRCFERAGLAPRLFLPFPDYKLPRLVLNAASVNDGLNLGQWQDWNRERLRFADPLVLPELEKNGLLADLANSFVVLATREGEPPPPCPWDAVYYSIGRRRCYQTETRLEGVGDGYVVHKSHLYPGLDDGPAGPVRHRVGRSPYVVGEKLSLRLLRAARRTDAGGDREFARLMAEWNGFLTRHATGADTHHARLPNDFLDCTPSNLLATGHGLEVIDREWEWRAGEVTVGWVLFRGLYWFLAASWDMVRCRLVRRGQWRAFVTEQYAALGYRLTAAELGTFVDREAAFHEAVLEGRPAADLADEIHRALGPTSPVLRAGRSLAFRTLDLAGRVRRGLRDGGQ